jgi:hypothetical protein
LHYPRGIDDNVDVNLPNGRSPAFSLFCITEDWNYLILDELVGLSRGTGETINSVTLTA